MWIRSSTIRGNLHFVKLVRQINQADEWDFFIRIVLVLPTSYVIPHIPNRYMSVSTFLIQRHGSWIFVSNDTNTIWMLIMFFFPAWPLSCHVYITLREGAALCINVSINCKCTRAQSLVSCTSASLQSSRMDGLITTSLFIFLWMTLTKLKLIITFSLAKIRTVFKLACNWHTLKYL